ncbi:hypothetical protein QSV36_10515 [Pseudomonas sp. BCRC 81390]|uniref:hypothetical protein n=1 Tax=Pseudomonas sp. BCRC 81390 TaxID=3054778 RepID=UPI002598BA30|nr:hypothetical protein [Pseudomonas sp. BCRC 81390]MDM3886031.1 hypothetical protein [Pseudomonas sp. BCRC 81390]
MKWIMLAAGVLILSGCSYNKTNVRNETEAAKYDPATTARIRIYSSPEKLAGFVPGKTCEAYHNHPVNGELQGMIWTREHDRNQRYILWRDTDLLGMQAEDYRNRVIGIPATAHTEAVKTDRLGYDEFVIPANQPVLVKIMYVEQNGSYCYPPDIQFVPKAGQDYEASLEFHKQSFISSKCSIDLVALSGAGSQQETTPVSTSFCGNDGHGRYFTVTP